LLSLPIAKLSCATEANVDFIASAISQGASTANGAAISNVRLFIPRILPDLLETNSCSYWDRLSGLRVAEGSTQSSGLPVYQDFI